MPDDVPLRLAVALAVRAGRRQLGMSQRAFAQRAGLSKSAVGRVETGRERFDLDDAASALAAVGLHLELVDANGRPWAEPVDALEIDQEDARDEAGRRLPAHLNPQYVRDEQWWHLVRRDAQAQRRGEPPVSLRSQPRLTVERPETTRLRRDLG